MDLRKLNKESDGGKHNPFADFFKGDEGEGGGES